MALVLVVSVLIGTVTALAMRSYLVGRLDQQVDSAMDRTIQALTDGPGFGGPGFGGPGFGGPNLGTQVGTVTAVLPDGSTGNGTLVTNGSEGDQAHRRSVSTTVLQELGDVPTDGSPHTVHLEGLGSYRVLAKAEVGGTITVALPMADVDDVVSNLVEWEVLLALLAVLGAGGAATFVVRRQLRPLRQVAATAHTVAGLPLAEGEIAIAPRVPASLTDERTEVGQVGSALNTLLVHVESSLAQRHRSEQQVRQFVADASHELRTPLTTIVGYTELARRRPDDPETVATALGKVEEESGRMTAMVEDLLLLARLEANAVVRMRWASAPS